MSEVVDITERLRHLEATLAVSTQHRARLLSVWSAARKVVEAAAQNAPLERKRELLSALADQVEEADPSRVVWPGVEDLTTGDQPEPAADQPPAAVSGNGHRIAVERCSAEKCHAPILWLRHERTHRAAPIDAEPAWGGNVVVDTQAGTWRTATEEEKHTLAGELRYPHHATCPARAQFTRKAGRGIG